MCLHRLVTLKSTENFINFVRYNNEGPLQNG